jgi:hypothetical protein
MSSNEIVKMCATKLYSDYETKQIETAGPTQAGSLRAAFYTAKLWKKNSEITISFVGDPSRIKLSQSVDSTVDPLESQIENMNFKDAIKKIVTERLQPLVNLKFVFVQDNNKSALVRIDFDPNKGSWSLLGTDCKYSKDVPTMNFAWFDVGTVLHEFGHMLGMIHEHQNPRGKKIQWDKEKVYNWAAKTQGWSKEDTDNNILNAYDLDIINGSDFDPLSVMLYFFPASLTTDNKGTQQNLRLSGTDVLWITKMYPNDQGPSPDTFYENIYKETINDSVEKSKKVAIAIRNAGAITISYDNLIKFLAFGVGCVLVYLFVTKVLLKKK